MTPERRQYARDYARRQRAEELATRNRGEARCQRRSGRHGVCGGILHTDVLMGGATVTTCPRCELRKAGRCVDCGRPVAGQPGKALRCAEHKKIVHRAAEARYADENRRKLRLKARAYHKTHREEKAAYKRRWRVLNPDKVKGQKRREALRQNPNQRAYHAAYRERHVEQRTERERRRHHATLTHPCLTCPAPLRGMAKKCAPCKERGRQAVLLACGATA